MTTDLRDYASSGYFLSRFIGSLDCTELELRRTSLAHDHSQRQFFPGAWTLSWCNRSHDERIEEGAPFGVGEHELVRVMEWADKGFGTTFGAWSVFFDLRDAREAARSLLPNGADMDLWGAGLRRSLVDAYCEASKPPPSPPGYAPIGASGVHIATCVRPAPLAEGGTVLGHELLVDDLGCAFNSPESLHLDEAALFREVGVTPNSHGLIDSFEEALACCRHLDAPAAETPHRITGWRPWLIVQYPLEASSQAAE